MSFRYSVPVDSLQKGDVVADFDGHTVLEVQPYSPAPGVTQIKVITKAAWPTPHHWVVEPNAIVTVLDW